ncbi:MAG: aminotransferase class I/II-fold pyridoxal phosphate-dependent enzyme [Clostridia bacterium]|nr:aminotransferase class I/II-fold pyridoxal phosphate-dependent enzyme [Clostridia bacterium]
MEENIKPFENKVWLSSPTMHGEELQFVKEAIETNWVSTVGKNIDELEKMVANYVGVKHAVALASGTSAIHLAVKLASLKAYNTMTGTGDGKGGSLYGKKVFCSDMTFDATVNPVVYEGGTPIFIDTNKEDWNMDPKALEKAIEMYPEVKILVIAHLYGVPANMEEIIKICKEHNILIVEDAAEALGAYCYIDGKKKMAGSLGDYNAISFNGNKIVTGSSGGMFLTDSEEDANKVRKWSTQARENAPWYQHEELGYNYRMSNIIAGIARGNMLHIDEHIAQKKAIYERYKEGFKDLPVIMNPFDSKKVEPNYWLSAMMLDKKVMGEQVRGEKQALYKTEQGKTTPTEILEKISSINAEGRPIWKPMHMQPLYRENPFITANGNGRANSNAYIAGEGTDVGEDIFERGLCLPSDNKMTEEEQDRIIEVIKNCFK